MGTHILEATSPLSYLPLFEIAINIARVRIKREPSDIAGVAMQSSPILLVATTENLSPAGTTYTFPTSLVK